MKKLLFIVAIIAGITSGYLINGKQGIAVALCITAILCLVSIVIISINE